ncbi:LIVCS family branched-chain amino acid:cation transporter [Scopulibacillus darangshiensis]|uniref:Branched-chain amino acid transport system carrier protein n=1 Tax=Scopulibacillus darangshiensis TaxID=442528 RepID=A0A4V2SKX4_9BACL|nr:branched-chain amino acid transport system II carrier protein [Scopulibacillus darangshiensis]TCP21076.1 LIVCS family branched-chain amino acid:cation transporter [Scopulibacillus darangshiensis]
MNKRIINTFTLGFALFAIFFGAGNLVFPPTIGLASGTSWVPAFIGFGITGIILPLLAVFAILNFGGSFEDLTKPISSWFHKVFNLFLMVGIGAFVTIPRMAATTHELGIHILFPDAPSIVTIIVFFSICFYFTMDKTNVVDKIGKILTPLLIVILIVIVGKGIFDPIGSPVKTDLKNPFSNAFISAYQTGDVVTGIFCAPIFIAAIIGHGYKGAAMRKVAARGVIIAGLGLTIVYGGLLFIGAEGSAIFRQGTSSTALVSAIVDQVLGNFGAVALAIAIALACLTSAIGVIPVIADFLNKLTKEKVGYRIWALIICILAAAVGSFGVDNIINYTMPIFTVLYPVAIVLVILGVFRTFIPNPGAYRGTILLTFLTSLIAALGTLGLKVPVLAQLITILPLSSQGFAWLVPAVIGFVLGAAIHKGADHKMEKESTISANE